MQTINHRPNLGIIGFGKKQTCQGVGKILFDQLGEYLKDEYNIHIYGCRKEGIEETSNSLIKRFYMPANLNPAQSLGHKIKAFLHLLRSSDLVLAQGTASSFFLPFFRIYKKKKVILYLDSIPNSKAEVGFLKKWWRKSKEKIAIRFADRVISEHQSVDQYIRKTYNIETEIIPMGGDHFIQEAISGSVFSFPDKPYALGVVNETSIYQTEMVLKALSQVRRYHIVLIGKWNATAEMRSLRDRYSNTDSIHLVDDESMKASLSAIKKGAAVYLHHHEEDRTHPFLLEEMSMGTPIITLDTPINREITMDQALYYSDENVLIDHFENRHKYQLEEVGEKMVKIIRQNHNWGKISRNFHDVFTTLYTEAHNEPEKKKEVLLLEERNMV